MGAVESSGRRGGGPGAGRAPSCTLELIAAAAVAAATAACVPPGDHFELPPLIETTYVKPGFITGDDQFGYSVALSADGSTLVVGAATEHGRDRANPSTVDQMASGAVYVFSRSGTTWIQDERLKASPSIVPDAGFGSSVAVSSNGSILAVGAPTEFNDQCMGTGDHMDGAVYVFVRNDGVWSYETRLESGRCRNERFGTSVALSGDGETLAIGVPGGPRDGDATQDAPPQDPGQVLLFTRSKGTWPAPTLVAPPGGAARVGDQFGWSVALSRDGWTLAVGANRDNERGSEAGAVYVSTRDAWNTLTPLYASMEGAEDWFGSSVALSSDGSTLAASAYLDDDPDNSAEQAGAVYVFTRGGGWAQTGYLRAENAGARDLFGWSMAISGDGAHLVIGAKGESSSAVGVDQDASNDDAEESGAAYVFAHGQEGWSQEAYLKAKNAASKEEFGYSVACTWDVSDVPTVVVGAWKERGTLPGVNPVRGPKAVTGAAGAAYVFEPPRQDVDRAQSLDKRFEPESVHDR